MARIDSERAHVVVRLVYDGPAKAGKTTSLRQLARSLGVDLFTAAEEDGRTLYFDWLDYTGGLFEGMPIRCQIVSVPGQQVFERRRRSLLESADAVVFVADSRPERAAENRRAYATLREVNACERVPIGIVVQANKRDLPGAVPLDQLRQTFGGSGLPLAMTEAVAERGEGVRETFVLGIRLALDRVRALSSDGALDSLPPEFEDGAQLLAAMMEREGASLQVVSPSIAAEPRNPETPQPHPQPPDASVPPGLVWPPVQGRVVVHEAARDAIHVEQHESGAWMGASSSGFWRLHSSAEASFDDVEHGREALIAWARWHSAASARLSADRAIVLAPSGSGEWRLWQIVHASHTLRDVCRDIVRQSGAAAGERLFQVIDLYAEAREALVATGLVAEIALDRITLSSNGTPVYAGVAEYPLERLPVVGCQTAAAPDLTTDNRQLTTAASIERELLDVLRADLAASPESVPDLLTSFEAAAARRGQLDLAQSLRRGLLNS